MRGVRICTRIYNHCNISSYSLLDGKFLAHLVRKSVQRCSVDGSHMWGGDDTEGRIATLHRWNDYKCNEVNRIYARYIYRKMNIQSINDLLEEEVVVDGVDKDASDKGAHRSYLKAH